ncbi:hypothetical protein ACFQU2_03985 [Siccirubricoccus deserti]|uniref:Uncharacterized protein n=1 Tax=Siccirubricoccus deserti TaxID=2013562 RepID=A0A9X0R2U8_9PROT|nr:hypothetical protein [Siccirubricoccus deserti]MBC4018801.1 hypothetical protein [Siccirubricoccus deserti]
MRGLLVQGSRTGDDPEDDLLTVIRLGISPMRWRYQVQGKTFPLVRARALAASTTAFAATRLHDPLR